MFWLEASLEKFAIFSSVEAKLSFDVSVFWRWHVWVLLNISMLDQILKSNLTSNVNIFQISEVTSLF